MAIPQFWFEIFGDGGGGIEGGPYAPLSHNHPVAQITDIADNYAALSHTHNASQIVDFDTAVTAVNGVQAAINQSHIQNTDTLLDAGNPGEVSAVDLRLHLDATNIHIPLDDNATGADRVFSAQRILSLINTGTSYTQAETDALLNGKQDTFGSQTANTVFSAPDGISGNPVFRLLSSNDIPLLDAAKITSGIFSTSLIPDLLASKISNFDNAVELNASVALNTGNRHTQNSDTILDQGNANEISAAEIVAHVTNSGIHFQIDDTTPSTATAYSGSKIDTLLSSKANNTDVYTSSQVDGLLNQKLNTFPAQTQNTFYGAPDGINGTPGFRILTESDIPAINASKVSDFQTQVSANNDVSANVSARHTQGTDSELDAGGVNYVTAAAIVNHINDTGIHTNINDGAASTSSIWSSQKVSNELNLKANAVHTHVLADISDAGSLAGKSSLVSADIPDLDSSKITTGIFSEARLPFNDAGSSASTLWSADKIALEISLNSSSVSELSDLSDIITIDYTAGFVLIADGTNFNSRALIASDMPVHSHALIDITDSGALAALNEIDLSYVTDAGSMASQNSTAINISGGIIDGVVIGENAAASGSFTSLSASGNIAVESADTNTFSSKSENENGNYILIEGLGSGNIFQYRPGFRLIRSKSSGSILLNEWIGSVEYFGDNGSTNSLSAYQYAQAVANWTSLINPSRLVWAVQETDSTNIHQIMLNPTLNKPQFGPVLDLDADLGAPSSQWRDLYLGRAIRMTQAASIPSLGAGQAAIYTDQGNVYTKNQNNVSTQISPHNPEIIPDEVLITSREEAYILSDWSPLNGKRVERYIDGLIAWAEDYSGQKFRFEEELPLTETMTETEIAILADIRQYENQYEA